MDDLPSCYSNFWQLHSRIPARFKKDFHPWKHLGNNADLNKEKQIFEFQFNVCEVCQVIFQAPVKSGLGAIEGPCPEKAGDTLEPPNS